MTMTSKDREDRILRYALHFEAGRGLRVSDPTGTIASLTRVTPRIRAELTEAAALAGVKLDIAKVGDEARARVIA